MMVCKGRTLQIKDGKRQLGAESPPGRNPGACVGRAKERRGGRRESFGTAQAATSGRSRGRIEGDPTRRKEHRRG